jgi:putative redox protein
MKAVIESMGGVASRCRLGDHTLIFDQPRTVPGGADRGPSPLDVMVASVGACAHYFASAYLYGRGLPTDALAVEVESDKDRHPTPRIARLTMTIHLPAGLTPQQIAGIERAVKSCPAYGTLAHPPEVEINLVSVALRQSA